MSLSLYAKAFPLTCLPHTIYRCSSSVIATNVNVRLLTSKSAFLSGSDLKLKPIASSFCVYNPVTPLSNILKTNSFNKFLPNRHIHSTLLPCNNFYPTSLNKISIRSQSNSSNEWDELQKYPLGQRLKVMFKKYWYVAIPLHCANCATWFVLLYILAKCGIDATILINFVKPYIVDSSIVPEFIKSTFEKDPHKLGHVAVAILLYKILTPARYATTVFASIFTLKHFLKKGVLVKTAGEQFQQVKNSYATHAINKNLKKRVQKMKKVKPPKK